jgi:hypothetical protein
VEKVGYGYDQTRLLQTDAAATALAAVPAIFAEQDGRAAVCFYEKGLIRCSLLPHIKITFFRAP